MATSGTPEAVATQLRSWWAANPFLSGIHWTSGIELGVRLLSWVWIRRLLDGWSGAGPLFEGNRTFLRQLHHHQEWLAAAAEPRVVRQQPPRCRDGRAVRRELRVPLVP